ncbi:MAG: type II secretion system protein GspN [Deltaproteobacteria bacterium]|nr:type II secretion system protein GspN [Deltaproteobacteria bacterium]
MHPVFLRKRWVLPAIGCAALGLVIFAVAFRALFPYPELARTLGASLRARGMEARFEGLGPELLAGLRAQSLMIAPVNAPDRRLEFRDATVHLSLARLLRAQLAVVLKANTSGGSLKAFWPLAGPRTIEASWDGIDLRRLPFSPDLAALGLRGLSKGTLEANLGTFEKPSFAGTIEASVEDAKLGPGNMAGMPLPGVSLGKGRLHLVARNGRIDLETVKFEGGNLDIRLTGTIGLGAPFPSNPVYGTLSLRPDDKALRDLGLLFAFLPAAQSSDGTYTSRLGGSLGSILLTQAVAVR